MKTVQEILDWIEEELADSLQNMRDESGNGPNNHMATALAAEYDMLERLKDFIVGESG